LVEGNFIRGKQLIFEDEVNSSEFSNYANSKGCSEPVKHSMIIIGVKKRRKRKSMVLDPNFWRNKYLCLVSRKYLASCRPTISFAPETGSVALSKDFTILNAHYVETFLEAEEYEEELEPEDC
jgi:hypothetical protein